jgi:hypothetical protein
MSAYSLLVKNIHTYTPDVTIPSGQSQIVCLISKITYMMPVIAPKTSI